MHEMLFETAEENGDAEQVGESAASFALEGEKRKCDEVALTDCCFLSKAEAESGVAWENRAMNFPSSLALALLLLSPPDRRLVDHESTAVRRCRYHDQHQLRQHLLDQR
jgi:hypothetical protein